MGVRIYRVEFGHDAAFDVVASDVLEAVAKAMKKKLVNERPKWKIGDISEVSLLAEEDDED